jgi:UDP-N-acetylglucosamine acyltransferase
MLAQGEGTFKDRATRLSEETDSDYVLTIVDFVLAESDRSFLTPS